MTAIETWFANPYAIYARHILGLEPLRRLNDTSDARDKGILYHAALHGFFQAYPAALPDNAVDKLLRNWTKRRKSWGSISNRRLFGGRDSLGLPLGSLKRRSNGARVFTSSKASLAASCVLMRPQDRTRSLREPTASTGSPMVRSD